VDDGFARAEVENLQGGELIRKLEIDNAFLCGQKSDGETAYFEIVVANGPFLSDFGLDAREFADPNTDFSTASWTAVCETAP
jgi:hypothetical protein